MVEFLLCFVFSIAVLVFRKMSVSAELRARLKLLEQNCLHKHSTGSVVSGNCRLQGAHLWLYKLPKIQPQNFPHGRAFLPLGVLLISSKA